MERARGIEPPRSNFGKPECESCGRTKNIEGERICRNFEYVAVPRNQSEMRKAGTQDSGLFFCVSYTLFSDSTGRNQDGKLVRGRRLGGPTVTSATRYVPSAHKARAHWTDVLCSCPTFFRIWTSVPPRSKETSSMANFIKWMPRPCSAPRFSNARGSGTLLASNPCP